MGGTPYIVTYHKEAKEGSSIKGMTRSLFCTFSQEEKTRHADAERFFFFSPPLPAMRFAVLLILYFFTEWPDDKANV